MFKFPRSAKAFLQIPSSKLTSVNPWCLPTSTESSLRPIHQKNLLSKLILCNEITGYVYNHLREEAIVQGGRRIRLTNRILSSSICPAVKYTLCGLGDSTGSGLISTLRKMHPAPHSLGFCFDMLIQDALCSSPTLFSFNVPPAHSPGIL